MPGPVYTQVSGHAEVSASDCYYPWLSASSGTQRARDLLIRSHRAGIRIRSEQSVTPGSSLLIVQAGYRPRSCPLPPSPVGLTAADPFAGGQVSTPPPRAGGRARCATRANRSGCRPG